MTANAVSEPLSAEPLAGAEGAELANGEEEVDEAAEEEAEIEEAQAEAEALLDAEGRGSGTVDARAEVRAPASTAALHAAYPASGIRPAAQLPRTARPVADAVISAAAKTRTCRRSATC